MRCHKTMARRSDEERLAALEAQAAELRTHIERKALIHGRPDPKKLGAYVGKRLREARESNGLTQSRLAAMVRIDQANLVRLEQGRHLVRLDLLIHLARVLDCTVASLLPEDGI